MKKKLYLNFAYIALLSIFILAQQQNLSLQISQKTKDIVQNKNIRQAMISLRQIGKPAVPFLVQLLNHKKARVRAHSALALAKMGKSAEKAIPVLVKLV